MEETQKQETQKQETQSLLKEICIKDCSNGESINKFVDKYLDLNFDETFYSEFEELDETEKDKLHNLVYEYAYNCEFMNMFVRGDKVYVLARFLRKMADESLAKPPVFK